jgi:2-polyprenyl-3-methyl-5-hydroxy-6-metoxy-1,4-benzoquinol methylase
VDSERTHHAEKDIRYHDIIAAQYDRVVVEPRWASINALFRPLSRMLPAHKRLMLDVGTGTGHMLRRFARSFASVVAVDHSQAMLDVTRASAARLGLANVDFAAADAHDFLAGEQRQFDLITAVGFLHHLQPSRLVDLLSLARARLAPGGVLIISEPIVAVDAEPRAIEWWNRTYRNRPELYDENPEDPDEAPLELPALKHALESASLRIVGEGRGWEIFPRHAQQSLSDGFGIAILHSLFGRTGPVYWAACRAACPV